MDVARNAPDAEVQAMACSYAANIYSKAIKDEAHASKLASTALLASVWGGRDLRNATLAYAGLM